MNDYDYYEFMFYGSSPETTSVESVVSMNDIPNELKNHILHTSLNIAELFVHKNVDFDENASYSGVILDLFHLVEKVKTLSKPPVDQGDLSRDLPDARGTTHAQ